MFAGVCIHKLMPLTVIQYLIVNKHILHNFYSGFTQVNIPACRQLKCRYIAGPFLLP